MLVCYNDTPLASFRLACPFHSAVWEGKWGKHVIRILNDRLNSNLKEMADFFVLCLAGRSLSCRSDESAFRLTGLV